MRHYDVGAFEADAAHKHFPEGVCDDEDANCKGWAKAGECQNNPDYMVGKGKGDGYCMFSCGKCPAGSKRAPKES